MTDCCANRERAREQATRLQRCQILYWNCLKLTSRASSVGFFFFFDLVTPCIDKSLAASRLKLLNLLNYKSQLIYSIYIFIYLCNLCLEFPLLKM